MGDSERLNIDPINLYISEFNEQFQKSRYIKNPTNDSTLTRSLTLMTSVQNVNCFIPNQIPITQFYINLYKLLSLSDLDEDFMWKCISILQHASKNLEARKALISKFRYFPLLANLLRKLSSNDKIEKFLTFLQELSYGINITWEEPYLAELIQTLLEYINSEDTDLAQQSILILINLCHKNFPVVCILMRTVNISELCKKIKKFGVLANKLLVILDKNNSSMTATDLECLMKKCFIDVEIAIEKCNQPLLQHIVYFFYEIKENELYEPMIVTFPHFGEEIQKVVEVIENQFKSSTTGNGDEANNNVEMCISLALEFLSLTLEISLVVKSKSEFQIPNDNLDKISEICRTWCNTDIAGVNAISLLKSLVELVNDDVLSNILDKFGILAELIAATENNEHSSQYTIALQKLLIVLLKKTKTENLIFSLITDSYFNKILTPVLSEKREFQNFSMCSAADLAKYLYCFLILVEFSKKAESTWRSKVDNFFQFYQMKYILAKGFVSDNPELSELVFEISKVDTFPKNEVSKLIVEMNKCSTTKYLQINSTGNQTNFDSFFERNRLVVSKDCEHRLNAILTKVFNSKQEFDNIATSELIELYMYKTNMTESKIYNLQKNLEDANERITNLTHENSLQTVELSKYTNINFQMNLTHEWLSNENKDLKKQRDIFKNTANNLGKIVKEKRELLKRHMKTHEIQLAKKINKIDTMQNEINKIEKQRDDYSQKIKNLTAESEEYAGKVESLKKSILLLEEKCQENILGIEQKDKEIIKLNKNIDELKKSHIMQDNIIKNLEDQIKDKNETIKQLEAEINEVEDMRKTIMSLMESKKPKRKV